jgi:hypothetical protein
MPTPLYPGIVRAQVTFENVNAIPRDRFVNTFHFESDASEGQMQDIADLLSAFYTFNYAGASVDSYLSPVVASASIRLYDLGEAEPRTPTVKPVTGAFTPSSGTALPNEIAVCLSYYADKNSARERGRVYLGPLATNVLGARTATDPDANLHADFRGLLTQAASALAAVPVPSGPRWCVLSPTTGGSAGPVTAGWVDSAFDVVRKRGAKALLRTNWT